MQFLQVVIFLRKEEKMIKDFFVFKNQSIFIQKKVVLLSFLIINHNNNQCVNNIAFAVSNRGGVIIIKV